MEFWSCSINSSQDQQTLSQLYSQGFLSPIQIPKKNTVKEVSVSNKFWGCFEEALGENKRGQNNRIRVLSIIANKFTYAELEEKLGVRKFICQKF